MSRVLNDPAISARFSAVLCLPALILLTLAFLGIEPHFGPLQPLLTNSDGHISGVIALLVLLLVPVALVVAGLSLLRAVRAGDRLLAHPASLLLTAGLLAFVVLGAGLVVVDQYPCWAGVPNCD